MDMRVFDRHEPLFHRFQCIGTHDCDDVSQIHDGLLISHVVETNAWLTVRRAWQQIANPL